MEQAEWFCTTEEQARVSRVQKMCKGEDTTGPGPQPTTPGSSTCIPCEWHCLHGRDRGPGQYWAVKNPKWPRRNLR